MFLIISNLFLAHIPSRDGSSKPSGLQIKDNNQVSSFRCWSKGYIMPFFRPFEKRVGGKDLFGLFRFYSMTQFEM